MPSTQNSTVSSSSLKSFCSHSELNHTKSKIESYLLSPPCTIALEEYFTEDEGALSLMAIFRRADSLSYSTTTASENERRSIALPQFPKDDGYVINPPTLTETPESICQSLLTSPPPTHYYDASDEETPRPIPQPQLAIRTSGCPCHTRNRGTLAFAVRLSCPSPPSPVFKEETTPSITPAIAPTPLPTERAQSEETWIDHCGRDTSIITCRYCQAEGHCQINCPHYFCRVCNKHTPCHLSARCPDLGKTKIIKATAGTEAFHVKLKAWEDRQDAINAAKEADWYKNDFHGDTHRDPDVYFNEDIGSRRLHH
ncbi:hypothetical protein CY34DRAFT_19415 [Suillus luteus UH-Slu-Lm8-n1]|uniref:Uncharacterized protein n=1 Tax=Suillus luteus UH-Slu-Lm8-n1 TaxID=930992 RepID=A0A0C9Z3H8_9AGAM|nr:hypothetical protein CY34DRAFT_19415 [Suillus luteus UH-Slu-Lm8-n1]